MSINHKLLAFLAGSNIFTETNTFNGIKLHTEIKSGDYSLTDNDDVVVFTATATATLPFATGSGQTYRVVCRSGTLTLLSSGGHTIKDETSQTLYEGEDLIVTDTVYGKWE